MKSKIFIALAIALTTGIYSCNSGTTGEATTTTDSTTVATDSTTKVDSTLVPKDSCKTDCKDSLDCK